MILDSINYENEDIIIVAPWNVLKKDDWYAYCSDRCNNGKLNAFLKKLGFKKVISHDTIFTSLDCEVFEKDTNGEKIKLGEFFTAFRLVAVFSLDEIKKYNPDFDYEFEEVNCLAVIIRDFTGQVNIKQVDDKTISVVGQGNVNFYSENLDWRGSMAREYFEDKLKKFAMLVKNMRNKQKTRAKDTLIESKQLEAAVDKRITEILEEVIK